MNAELLIVEDEPEFASYLKRGLRYAGYQVHLVNTAEIGLMEIAAKHPDLVILDVMLPGMDGMQACRQLRQQEYVGSILMLTARNAINDRVTGLDAGADDYLCKPFSFDELLARIRSLLRRSGSATDTMNFADLELDIGLRTARRQEATISLTATEFDLLVLFLSNPAKVLTRETIIENVWGYEYGGNNVLDVYISRLRRKIGDPLLIHTLYGVGYVLKE